jgi:hypothetical protein
MLRRMGAPESAAESSAFSIERLVELAVAWPRAPVVIVHMFRNVLGVPGSEVTTSQLVCARPLAGQWHAAR